MNPQLAPLKTFDKRRPMFRHRPALALLIAVLAGMACANAFPISLWKSFGILTILLLGFALSFVPSLRPYRSVVALLLSAALGMSLYGFSQDRYDSNLLRKYATKAKEAKVGGIVKQVEQLRNGDLLIIDVDNVSENSLRLPIHGRVAATLGVTSEDDEMSLPSIGDTITFFATLQPLRLKRNPYVSSYDERLMYHYGAHATAQLTSRFDYHVKPTHAPSFGQKFKEVSEYIRVRCERILDRMITDRPAAAFVKAVVLGIRSGLSDETVLDFKQAGLTHLLAISGFNIAVVSLLIAQALLLFGVRRRAIRLPVTALCVAFYCFVVGFEPSVFRAFIMVELYLLAMLLERKTDLANLAAATALVHLFIDPTVIHDAGFQLSYAAVFGFALIQPELSRLFEPTHDGMRDRTFVEWLWHSLILSVSAFVATAPILIFHFRQIPIIVFAANLLAIPMAALITILGFIVIPLGYVWPWAAALYGDVLSWLINGFYIGSSGLSSIGGNGAVVDMNIGALLLFALLIVWSVRVSTPKKLFGRLIAVAFLSFGIFSFLRISHEPILTPDKLSIIFADVGQGDAIILKTPSGKFFMFDFGPLTGSDPAFGARPYAPLLQTEGANKLEAGFITHLHRDHYGALLSAMDAEVVQTLYTVGDRTKDEFAYSLDSVVQEKKIDVRKLHTGQVLDLDHDVKLYVLGPDSSDTHSMINNDRSLVLKLVYGNTSYLLLGDIEQEGEISLIERFGSFLKSDVVKVAHHGSISSSTRGLVAASDSRYAVISCGRNNRFGHPHPVIVSRWMRSGSEVLRTDLDGAIILESDGEKVERVEWRSK